MNDVLFESERAHRRGVVVREIVDRPSRRVAVRLEPLDVERDAVANRAHALRDERQRQRVEIGVAQKRIAAGAHDQPPLQRPVGDRSAGDGFGGEAKVGPQLVERGAAHQQLQRRGGLERGVLIALVQHASVTRVDRVNPDVRAAQRGRAGQRDVEVRVQRRDLGIAPRRPGRVRLRNVGAEAAVDGKRRRRADDERRRGREDAQAQAQRHAATRSARRRAMNVATSLGSVPRPNPAS